MKRLIAVLLLCATAGPAFGYSKVPLVERFTNTSCGPCATLNNAWYNAVVQDLGSQGYLNHVVYNVNWPGPTDPMYLLNAADNMIRRGFYNVNSVPWIEVDGVTFVRTGNTSVDQANFTNLIMTTATSGYAPFQIDLTADRYVNNTMDLHVTLTRDPADTTSLPEMLTLQVGLAEDVVTYTTPPGSSGETVFYDVCRKMVPDGIGLAVPVPAPGGSFSTTMLYVPTAEALVEVDFELVRAAAFIQNDLSREVHQSKKVATVFADRVHAAFVAADDVGAAPLTVQFEDLSTPSSTLPIVSWAWDLDGDGEIDSTEPEPAWTYPDPGLYSVTLTVSDGTESHTTTRASYIRAITNAADILVVNGIEQRTYPAEMATFYTGSAVFGDHQVDVWDLFGVQEYDYGINPDILQVIPLRRNVPDSVLRLYQTVIWVGNNYGGDLDYFHADQVLSYLADGGNLILATRMGSNFLTPALRTYCGIASVSGDRTLTGLVALDPGLVDMAAVGSQSTVHTVTLATGSEATPIFQEPSPSTLIGGFRLQKQDEGTFIFVAGRPYRYDTAASYQNYDFMLNNWMHGSAAVGDELLSSDSGRLRMAWSGPSPFSRSTEIRFALGQPGAVSLKIYDAGGRLVRTLSEGDMTAGGHVVPWDARDNTGAMVGGGLYLYRLEVGGESRTGRTIVVR